MHTIPFKNLLLCNFFKKNFILYYIFPTEFSRHVFLYTIKLKTYISIIPNTFFCTFSQLNFVKRECFKNTPMGNEVQK